jgi:hypothetical protein
MERAMAFAVGNNSLVNYKLAVQNRDRLLTQFQKMPDYARSVAYFKANIGKVASPEDLLKDRRLLAVTLSAFQLEDEIDAKGIIRKLLTDDPTDPKSLAQRMVDPRFRQFAQFFASLKSDGGKQLASATTQATLLDKYQTNEYQKWLGQDDPAVRQALYFQDQIDDTIDLKNVHDLMATFQKSPGVADAMRYYQDNVGKVATVDDLLKDDKLLSVTLSAFGVDQLLTDKATVRRLLTEDPTKADSLAQSDPSYLAFAKGLASLRYDGGAQLHDADGVKSVLAAYQANEFEKSLSLGADEAQASFATQIANSDPTFDAATYYRANIGAVKGVDGLLGDDKLLGVALGAFDLGALAGDKDTVRRLLTEDRTAPGSLAGSDPRYMQFATEFASLQTDGGAKIGGGADVDAVVGAYQAKLYGDAPTVSQSIDYYKANIQKVTSVNGLLNDGMLLNVALSAYGLNALLNDKTTVRQLLTEDPAAAGSLAQSNSAYMAFATEFQSLRSDGGARIRSDADVATVTAAFTGQLFDNEPTADQEIAYYKANIGRVSSADDLMNDGMLLHVALASNGLGALLNDKTTVGRLLDDLPQLPNSLASTDPRYMAFAQQFSTMWMDGGAAVRSADGVAGVTGAFQNKLLRQSATAGDLAQYYRDRIGGVTSDADLLADDQLLAVALGAFGLGSLAGDKTTVQRLLTEDPTAPGSLAQQNADYGRFAAEFASLKSDGGAKVHGLADIDSLATSYLGAESGRLAALDQPAARSGLYGTAGEKAIGTLLTNFTSSTGYKQAVAYYGANIGKVTSVDGLLKDSQLLGVALSAFRMDGLAQSPATLRQLLTEDPDAADSLARTDPRYMAFARAFAPLKDGN